MARPKKSGVDYFPHQCSHGETMFILERKYQNNGYAVWFKILESLGKKSDHYLDCSSSTTWEYLTAKTHLEDEKLTEILDLLARLGAIDSELWLTDKVIWSDNFINGIADVYQKRGAETPLKPGFRDRNPRTGDVSGPESTQREEREESKVKRAEPERAALDHFSTQILEEITKELETLCLDLEDVWKEFNPYQAVQRWASKYHHEAILHVLRRMVKEKKLIKSPWGFANKVVEDESMNYHVRDGETKHRANLEAFAAVAKNFNIRELTR